MRKWKSGFMFIQAVLWISLHSTAGISFLHYGLEQGLPEQNIVSITQDSAGFIWMAGEYNIYRFDGFRFSTYNQTSKGFSEQPLGKVITLHTDSKGTIWAGTSAGISSFDYSGNQFKRVINGWLREDVNDIDEDHQGNLWMATNRGIAKVNPDSRHTVWYTDSTIIKTPLNNVLPTVTFTHIACQDDGKIWFSNSSGKLFLFDPVSQTTTDFSVLEGINLMSAGINGLEFTNNTLFIGTLSHGLVSYNTTSQNIQSEDFSDLAHIIKHFKVSNDSIVWIASDNGLIRFNYKSGDYTRYTEEPGNPLSLSRSALNFIYEDRDRNLWISTGLKGINYGLTDTPFHQISYTGTESYQLSRPEVTAIHFDNNRNMWLGYEGGFLEKHFPVPVKKRSYYPGSVNEYDIPGAVFAIHTDKQNRVWFGGWKSGLRKLNQSATEFIMAPIKPDSLAGMLETADIRGITEDEKGNLWICFHGFGLGRYIPATHTMELFRNDPGRPFTTLSNDWTLNSCHDKKGNLWIATSHGVSKYNLKTKTFENYFHEETNPEHSLNSNKIHTIYCDPAGVVWAGTDVGLNVYNPDINSFLPVYNSNENIPHNITAIRSVKPGELWVSTVSGIIHLKWTWDTAHEKPTFEPQYHNRKTGLLSTIYFHRSSAVNSDGDIFFGGNSGIDIILNQKNSRQRIKSPTPHITQLTVDGQHVPFNFYKPEENILNLNHNNKTLNIRFASPEFNNPKKPGFRFMMEGFEEEWNYTQSEQVANYTNLPAGDYTFCVEVENGSGGWNQNAASFTLVVKPPFWNTIPFYVFAGLTLLAAFGFVSYARSRFYRHRQKQLEKIIKARTKELTNKNAELENIIQTKNKLFSIISHDLRSPFAGVIGILDLLTEEDPDLDEERKKEMLALAKGSAENTFELLENLLSWAHSQMKKNVSRPEQHNLGAILNKNIQLRIPSAQQKKIEILKNFPEILHAKFDREMINTVIRNLLNNAVKFTHEGGKIEVSAFRINGEVKVSIADTGIGMDESITENLFQLGNSNQNGTNGEKGTGLGLIICREFIEKNHGKIGYAPNNPNGTVFYFSLPAN